MVTLSQRMVNDMSGWSEDLGGGAEKNCTTEDPLPSSSYLCTYI